MKKYLLLLFLIVSVLGHSQDKVKYLRWAKYTTAQKLAINTSDTSIVYEVYDDDLGRYETYNHTIGVWEPSAELPPLKAVDEGNGIGYRLRDTDTSRVAPIGYNAFDYGRYADTLTDGGARGDYSVVYGLNNRVAGEGDFVTGSQNTTTSDGGYNIITGAWNKTLDNTVGSWGTYYNIINGYHNQVGGYNTIINGDYNKSTPGTAGIGINMVSGRRNEIDGALIKALGAGLKGAGSFTTILGQANVDFSESTGMEGTSNRRLLVVGNGNTNNWGVATSRSDAFRVWKSGLIEAPSLTEALINADTTGQSLTTKKWVLQAIDTISGGGSGGGDTSEWASYAGTRAGEDLVVTLGDYDGSGNDFKVILDQAEGELYTHKHRGNYYYVDDTGSVRFVNGSGNFIQITNNPDVDGDIGILYLPRMDSEAKTLATEEDVSTAISGLISDTAYNATSWDGVDSIAPSKNAVRDKFESISTSISGLVSNTAYNATSWDGVTTIAPSKDAIRDEFVLMPRLNVSNTFSQNNIFSGGIELSSLRSTTGTNAISIQNDGSVNFADQLQLKSFVSDPSLSSSGRLWYNSTNGRIRIRVGSDNKSLAYTDDISGGGATQISADSVFVSPTIKGYGNAYELLEAHQTSIDSIQANMVTGINTEFQEEDYSIDFDYAFDPKNPNKYIDLEGDIEITIYGTVNGDSGYLYLNRSTGSELIEFGNGNAPKNTSYPMQATDVVKLYFIHSYLGIQWYLENPTSTQNVKQTILGTGTATIDFTKGNIVNFLFSSVSETPNIIDPANNTEVYMIFTQDNTGGKAFNFPSKFAGVLDDTPDEVAQGANEKSFYKFLFTDGIYYPIVMNRDVQFAEPEPDPIYGVSFISDTGGNNPSNGPEKAFDGNLATYSTRFNSALAYIGMDYGTAVIINKVKVWARQDATFCTRTNGALIQYSNNGTTWTTVFTVSGIDSMNYTSAVEGTFSPVSARYWRAYFPEAMSYGSAAEIEFYPAL